MRRAPNPNLAFMGVLSLLVSSESLARADDDEVVVHGRAGGFVSEARVGQTLREVTDAASLVESLPGVHVRRLGADDAFATLSVRGSSSSQVAVYFAGVPLSGGADPSLDLATLPLWPGAGARVFRSFAPAAIGRGSLGGTLVIDPPSPRATPRTEVWTALGSFGARRLRMGDVRQVGDAKIATGFSASRSDDDFTYLDHDATLAAGRDLFAPRLNAGHAAVSGLVSVALPVRVGSSLGALTVSGLAQARRQELPGSAKYPTRLQRLDSSRLVSALELTVPIADVTGGVRFWGRREDLAVRDDPTEKLRPWSTDDAILAVGSSAGVRTRGVEVRIDGSAERFAPGTWLGGATAPPGARRTNGGLAADASTALGDLKIAASARADTWLDTSDDGTSHADARPTGHVGLEFPLGPIALATHGGFVARPPSFVERYGNRGAFIGNTNLRAESAFTADAGARYGSRSRFGAVRLNLESSLFASWADDLITYVPQGIANSLLPTNIGTARIFGAESSVRARLFGFEARASHTALATANGSMCTFTRPGQCERPPLPGRPAHELVADLAYERGPVRLRYGVDVVTGIRVDSEDAFQVPTRVLHGASARFLLHREIAVTFDLRNLFDLRAGRYAGGSRYPIGDLYDYPLPGRRFMLSITWSQAGLRPASFP